MVVGDGRTGAHRAGASGSQGEAHQTAARGIRMGISRGEPHSALGSTSGCRPGAGNRRGGGPAGLGVIPAAVAGQQDRSAQQKSSGSNSHHVCHGCVHEGKNIGCGVGKKPPHKNSKDETSKPGMKNEIPRKNFEANALRNGIIVSSALRFRPSNFDLRPSIDASNFVLRIVTVPCDNDFIRKNHRPADPREDCV